MDTILFVYDDGSNNKERNMFYHVILLFSKKKKKYFQYFQCEILQIKMYMYSPEKSLIPAFDNLSRA